MSHVELTAGREAMLSKTVPAPLDRAVRVMLVRRGKLSCRRVGSGLSWLRAVAGFAKVAFVVLESWIFKIVASKLVAGFLRLLIVPTPPGESSHQGVSRLVYTKGSK